MNLVKMQYNCRLVKRLYSLGVLSVWHDVSMFDVFLAEVVSFLSRDG